MVVPHVVATDAPTETSVVSVKMVRSGSRGSPGSAAVVSWLWETPVATTGSKGPLATSSSALR
jgi:hypothetical protein